MNKATRIKQKDLQELQTNIHEINRGLGWWDKPRTDTQFFLLFDSELTEAFEAVRRGDIADDHLPQYRGFTVEIADFVIRVLDYLGSKSFTPKSIDYHFGNEVINAINGDEVSFVAFLKFLLVDDYYYPDKSKVEVSFSEEMLSQIVIICFAYMNDDEHFLSVISEKVSYNKKRADHKRENRALKGGKQF